MSMRFSQLKRGLIYSIVSSVVLFTFFGCSSSDYMMSAISHQKPTATITISTLTPNSGSYLGDTTVTIKGSGFVDGQTSVYFDDYASNTIKFISSEELEVTTPESDRSYTNTVDVRVSVSSSGGDIEANFKQGFTYIGEGLYCEDGIDGECVATCDEDSEDEWCPYIDYVDPESMIYNSTGDRSVEISGENFESAGLKVTFGSIELTNCSVPEDEEGMLIECTVPTEGISSLGTVDVMVEFNDEEGNTARAILEEGFTFEDSSVALTPSITKIDPAQGYHDDQETEVMIEGGNFLVNDDEDNELTLVYFGEIKAECDVEDEETIYCIPPTPENAIGQVHVKVVVKYDDGLSRETTLEYGYTYLNHDEAAPTITNISPESGYDDEATAVTITGTNFVEDDTYVSFGKDDDFYDADDCVVSENGTKISCNAPESDLVGKVDVMVEVEYDDDLSRTAFLQDGFEYKSKDITDECDPDSEDCDNECDPDSEDCDDDDDDDDENDDGVTISKVDPTTARVNTKKSFTVWGTHFKKGRTKVKIGDQKAKGCVVHKGKDGGEDRVKCKTPSISESGEYELQVIVTKKAKDGSKTKKTETYNGVFTITDSEDEVGDVTVTRVEPSVGEANKKTTFKIYGTGFKKKKKMEVKIDGNTATCNKVKLQSASKGKNSDSGKEDWIRCKTPKLSEGSYPIEITVKSKSSGKKKKSKNKNKSTGKSKNTSDVTVTATELFEFKEGEDLYNAPTISSIVPNSGSEDSKTEFKIKGTNFSKDMTVEIGGEEAKCDNPKLAKKNQEKKNGEDKEDTIKCKTPKLLAKEDGGYYSLKMEVVHSKKGKKDNKVKKTVEVEEGFKFTKDESATAPTIESVSPSTANIKSKTEFTITGYYFNENKKKMTVKIGNKSADCDQATADDGGLYTLKCKTPSIEYAGSYDLKVSKRYRKNGKQKKVSTVWSDQDLDKTDAEEYKFVITDDGTSDDDSDKDPTITNIDPATAPKNTKKEFTVYGTNFKKNKTKVWIGDKKATKCKVNEEKTSITCKTPKIAQTGKYSVKVEIKSISKKTQKTKKRHTTMLEGFTIE